MAAVNCADTNERIANLRGEHVDIRPRQIVDVGVRADGLQHHYPSFDVTGPETVRKGAPTRDSRLAVSACPPPAGPHGAAASRAAPRVDRYGPDLLNGLQPVSNVPCALCRTGRSSRPRDDRLLGAALQ